MEEVKGRKVIIVEKDSLLRKKNVVESNQIIEAHSNLSGEAQKLLYVMVAMIGKDDKEFVEHTFKIKDLKELFNSKTKRFYELMERSVSNLLNGFITFRNPDGDGYYKLKIVESASYVEGKGAISIKLNDVLTPFFLQLQKNFTQIPLPSFLSLRSTFSMKILSLITAKWNSGIAYVSIPQKEHYQMSFIVSVERLKDMFLGDNDTSSTQFKNLKGQFLIPAITEVNEKSVFNVVVDYLKSGRFVKDIKFRISYNEEGKRIQREKNKVWDEKSSICGYFSYMFSINSRTICKLHEIYEDHELKAAALSMQKYQDDYMDGEVWHKPEYYGDFEGIRSPVNFLKRCLETKSYLENIGYEYDVEITEKIKEDINKQFDRLIY